MLRGRLKTEKEINIRRNGRSFLHNLPHATSPGTLPRLPTGKVVAAPHTTLAASTWASELLGWCGGRLWPPCGHAILPLEGYIEDGEGDQCGEK